MRQIFLDTETTGLSPENGDRVIEIGCVELVNRKLTGNNMHFYLNPGRDSHEEALKVHGLTSEFLRDKPVFEAVADDLLAYLHDAEIIIHNAAFDVGFLNRELALLGRAPFREFVRGVTDTLALAKELFPGKRNSLDALCARLGVDNSGRTLHGALLDAELLAEVYLAMTRGQNSLEIEFERPAVDYSMGGTRQRPPLVVLAASAAELAEHARVLGEIDKESKGKCLWRELENTQQA